MDHCRYIWRDSAGRGSALFHDQRLFTSPPLRKPERFLFQAHTEDSHSASRLVVDLFGLVLWHTRQHMHTESRFQSIARQRHLFSSLVFIFSARHLSDSTDPAPDRHRRSRRKAPLVFDAALAALPTNPEPGA